MSFVKGFSDESKLKKMQYNLLGETGLKISKLSLGGGAFGGGLKFYGDYDKEEAKMTVVNAIQSGINFIDAGPHYGAGLAEEFLGEALKVIPREAYYISTKVGRICDYFNFSAEFVTKSFNKSLKRLKLSTVDIVFIHDVEFAESIDTILNETLPAVEKFILAKKAKYIGISGYPLSILLEVVNRSTVKIDCILSYCRETLIDNSLKAYASSFQSKGIGIINAGCIGMGLLTNQGPPSWHPAKEETKKICHDAAKYCEENEVELGKLALFHALNEKNSDTCLVGMKDLSILQANLDVLWNGLSEKELSIFNYIVDKYFPRHVIHHWEGIKVHKKSSEQI